MEVVDATDLAERLRWEDNEYWLHFEVESPLDKYPAKQHAQRVQEKLGVDEGLIYLPGQPARNNEDSDMPAPFRQRRYFYYLSGCNEPGCHLTYDIRHDTLTLFIPRINPARVIWNGRGSTPAEALVKYDIDEVCFVDELQAHINEWTADKHNRHAAIYVLHQAPQALGTPKPNPRIDAKSLQPAMNIARMVKDEHEINLIRKANDISSQAHREVLANILSFKNEAQVEGLFMNVCISNQAKQQAYDPIAASGPNAGTLHYDANNEDLAGRQLMCLDAGCEYELYASDITRTFPLSHSWPSIEAENIYKLVQLMQETCIERLAPGVRYLDLHILAHQIAIDGLLRLGILHNGTKEEIYKAGTSKAFFPHGLGHHIGLEVHDVGQAELMSVRRGKPVYQQAPSLFPENFHNSVYDPETCHAPTDPQSSHLEEGMVVTVEPGIYFSVYALQHFYLPSPIHSKYINVEVVQRYLPVGGVRIEDDILITSKSYENLTTAPKGEAMLDIIRVGKSSSTETQRGTSSPRRRSSDDVEIPLRRAPGISNKIPQLIQRPLARAATMPAELPQQTDIDFEPYTGPSLFSNFPRSMTTEEKVQHWRRSRDPASTPRNSPATVQKPLPVCGELDPNFQHVYMSDASNLASSSRTSSQTEGVSACKNCHLLVQTLHRLRQNLSSSAQTSPKPEAKQPSWTGPLRNGMETARAENPGLVRHMNEAATKVSLTPVPVIQANRQEDKSKSRFSTRYVPYNELLPKHPHDLDNRTSRTVPSHKQPAVGADKNQHKRQPIHPVSSSGHPNPGGLPIPPAIPSNAAAVEDVRQHLEALQIKLQSLENNATLLKQSRPQHSYHGNPHPRPSMPDLSSHNPWQQHTTLPHQPAHSTSVNELLDELMADEERLKRGEPEMLMHRTQRTAARRNKLYLR